jgi:hypothetical protein
MSLNNGVPIAVVGNLRKIPMPTDSTRPRAEQEGAAERLRPTTRFNRPLLLGD